MAMSNPGAKEFEELAALVGTDMQQLKRDMATLCGNQEQILEEIKLMRTELIGRIRKLNEEKVT